MAIRFKSPLVYMRESYSIRCKMLFLAFVVKSGILHKQERYLKKEIWLHFNCGICFYMYCCLLHRAIIDTLTMQTVP